MSNVEELLRRTAIIESMHTILSNANNEDIWLEWATVGTPDGSTAQDFTDYAANKETFFSLCEEFIRIMRMGEDVHDYFYYIE